MENNSVLVQPRFKMAPPDRNAAVEIPHRIRDLAILAKAAAHSVLGRQSVETDYMEELLLEIGRLYLASQWQICGLVERLDARDAAAANRTKSEQAMRESHARQLEKLTANLVAENYDELLRRSFDEPFAVHHGYHVYLLWGADSEKPVYVGKSTNVVGRIQTHMRDPQKRGHFNRVQLIRCISEQVMSATESRLIRWYQPILNKAGLT